MLKKINVVLIVLLILVIVFAVLQEGKYENMKTVSEHNMERIVKLEQKLQYCK